MFVIELTYLKPLEEVERHLEAHRAYLAEQFANGLFLASGPKEPRTGGVILARVETSEQLAAVLARDPFVIHGIADYRIVRFHVRATAPGLEQLAGVAPQDPRECESLAQVRSRIDAVDERIVRLLAERGAYVRRAASFKQTTAEVHAPERVKEVLTKVAALASALGADPDIVRRVYQAMIAGFVQVELDGHAAQPAGAAGHEAAAPASRGAAGQRASGC